MTADNGLRGSLTEQDREQYEQRWTDFMVKFWQEKMMKFSPPVYDTGALYQSLAGVLHPGTPTTIEHHFLEYGIYVAAGVGNGYNKGNGGDLDILDPSLRKAARLDKPRSRGPRWTYRSSPGRPGRQSQRSWSR